ncbi:MAG: DinB family protein, partial [Planctomycetota bacterium]
HDLFVDPVEPGSFDHRSAACYDWRHFTAHPPETPAMHPTVLRLTKSRERLLGVIGPLPESDLDRPASGDWTIRQTLTHLALSEEDHCRVVEAIVSGATDQLPRDLALDAHNASRLAAQPPLERPALLAALAAQRERTLALFAGLSDAQLALTGPHPALGAIAAGDIFRVIAVHEQMHLRDIQAALDA